MKDLKHYTYFKREKLLHLLDDWEFRSSFLEISCIDLFKTPKNSFLQHWIDSGFHGNMQWLQDSCEKRINPVLEFKDTPTAILFALPYFHSSNQEISKAHKISLYALGRDYHKTLRTLLKRAFFHLKTKIPDLEGRWHTDSGPVSEKFLAEQSGMGWIGKNSNLLIKKKGSFFFLGTIFVNLHTDGAQKHPFFCGSCTRCLDICPTQAIVSPGVIDSRKCLSYQTIERKTEEQPDTNSWAYGCDDCQTCCPFNHFSQTGHPDFLSRFQVQDSLGSLSEKEFETLFAASPIKRAGYKKFTTNYKKTHLD